MPTMPFGSIKAEKAEKASVSAFRKAAGQVKQGAAAADRKALPAGVYYSIMEALLQHRQDLQLLHMDQQLQHLQQELQSNPITAVAAAQPTTGHKHTVSERLSNLCCMMQHRVAPYQLAMGPHELLLAVLQSLPWLYRPRSRLQLFEEAEWLVLMHGWAQYKQHVRDLSGTVRVAAAVDMSRTARLQLLRSFTRHLLAAEDPQASSSSSSRGAAQQSSRKEKSSSLIGRWCSFPARLMMQRQSTKPQQLRAGSTTASYMREVREYSSSPYPRFEELLDEELRRSITAHHLRTMQDHVRVRSSPAAAAGFDAAGT